MRSGGTSRHNGMIGSLETKLDRHIAGGQIDQPAGNEERRNSPWSAFLENDGGFRDALHPAYARADHHPGRRLVFRAFRFPSGIFERLARGAHGIHDEVVYLALLLRLHPLIRIVGAVTAITARYGAGNLAGKIRDFETFDLLGAARSVE